MRSYSLTHSLSLSLFLTFFLSLSLSLFLSLSFLTLFLLFFLSLNTRSSKNILKYRQTCSFSLSLMPALPHCSNCPSIHSVFLHIWLPSTHSSFSLSSSLSFFDCHSHTRTHVNFWHLTLIFSCKNKEKEREERWHDFGAKLICVS